MKFYNHLLIILFISYLNGYSQIDYTKFEGIKSKISLIKEFPFSNVYDYKYHAKKEDSSLIQVLNIP